MENLCKTIIIGEDHVTVEFINGTSQSIELRGMSKILSNADPDAVTDGFVVELRIPTGMNVTVRSFALGVE